MRPASSVVPLRFRHRTSRLALLLATTALTGPGFVSVAAAQNLPTGSSVAAGSASVAQPSSTSLAITQSSQSAVVNWQSFSIGQGYSVNIVQPNASSALLNRVTGNTPSSIAGSLTANGQVYLVNPNGIAITPTGAVNVGGGFVASTLGISDADFMSGKRGFTGNGASAGVSNAGTITVGRGGYAALIGGTVTNSGNIYVPLGKVGLGSGEQATLDFSGDGFLQVALPTSAKSDGALIQNSGTIKADGGAVIMSAATAREAARNAINISGVVQARSIGGKTGAIEIGGGEGGQVTVSGKLTTASRKAKGGNITVTGKDIVLAGAKLNASGKTGGGSVKVGGDRQGGGTLQRADTVTMDAASRITADATGNGNGGNVVVWSDVQTNFAGTISAKGGADGGNGGEAEVSGKAKLAYTGFTDLSAVKGRFGTLLLDPYNVIISNAADTSGFTASGNDSIINAGTLQTALGSANVTVTTGSGGSQTGDITVSAPVTWLSNAILTLSAYHSIAINANIMVAGGGGLALNSNQGGTGGTITYALGSSASFASGQSGQSLSINGQSYTLIYSLNDLQNINSGLTGRYALATSIEASATQTWNGSLGFFALGMDGHGTILNSGNGFTGTFDGLGNQIGNLYVRQVPTDNVGLFGYIGAAGLVRNVGLPNVNVSGSSNNGAIAGYNKGTITQSWASGIVSGAGNVGGLVGNNDGTVSNSFSNAAVQARDSNNVGGLVGRNTGSISQSYATGSVLGSRYVGGLVGMNINLGAGATITQSYATGAVATFDAATTGGLVGDNLGTVSSSVFDTTTSGQTNGIGSGTNSGVTGLTTAQLQGGTANGLGAAFGGGSGGLYPYLSIFYPNGVQAISGIAYKADGVTPLSSGTPQPTYVKNPAFVSADINGAYLGGVTTGVNGYYYIVAPSGLLKAGAKVVAYTNLDADPSNSSGATNAATVTIATGASSLPNLNIYGNMLTSATSSLLLSGAPTAADATTAAGGDPMALAAINGATGRLYLGAGASLSIDQAITTSSALSVRTVAASAPITVDAPITINGSGSLTLNATGGVQVNKTISVTGAGAVNITAAPVADVSTTGLTFALGASIDYGATDNGGTFVLNGSTYTLVYSMANLDAIDGISATTGAVIATYGAGISGSYAIATNLDASGITYNQQLLSGGLSGKLDGLGHTVSNLTLGGGVSNAGMISVMTGTVSNFGLVGGSVNGNLTTGSIAGSNNGGVIQTSYSSATVYGSQDVGGLVGFNTGTIQSSFVTGNVTTGGQYAGGLAGRNTGLIKTSAASGTVSANQYVGGLVGRLEGGGIQRSLFTGLVTNGGGYVGGIAGYVAPAVAPLSNNLYWDVQTSGTSAAAGYDVNGVVQASGLTTANLQNGTLPSGLASTIWGAGAGLYPYLKNFYPTGPQVLSGTAYSDGGSTGLAGSSIGLIANGASLGSVSSGANGYYYFALAPGAWSTGANLLTYSNANSATLATASGAAVQGGVNLYGQTLTAPTSATLLSTTKTAVATAAGGNAAAIAAINGASLYNITATGASFTVDQTINASSFAARTTTAGASLIVANAITIQDGGSLTLNSAGTLRINAPVSMKGASTASLSYDASDPANFTFAIGAPLTYANADGSMATASTGGTLSINGQSYQLLYTMGDLAGINGGSGKYALVNSLSPAGTYSDAIVGYFTGTFDGLGHTITGLTINSGSYAALFGNLSGTVRDIGLVGGAMTGGDNSGALAGRVVNGVVANVYAMTPVVSGSNAGGLIGYMSNSLLVNSFATGTAAGNGYGDGGGLVGYAGYSTIRDVFATGAASGYYAGGLIGYGDGGSLTNAYATGAVNASVYVGGLLGINGLALTNVYSDVSTTGRGGVGYVYTGRFASNGTGTWTDLTTAQFQSGASSLGAAFAGGANGFYPYLKSFFSNGVQVVSGYAMQQDGVSPLRTTVSVANGGAVMGTASTGVNGYYYVFAPAGTASNTSGVTASSADSNSSIAFRTGAVGPLTTNLNLTDGWRYDTVDLTVASLSALNSAFATTVGTTAASTLSPANRQIDSSASTFALDQALSVTGTLGVSSNGTVTQSAAVTAGGLLLTGTGSFTLDASGNQIGTLAANSGGLTLVNTGSLAIGSLANAAGATTSGVTATGAATVSTDGDLTIASGATVSGTDVVLAATGAFINNRGADAVTATSGRWLIYSSDPANDTFGSLDSRNTAIFGNTYASLAPGSVALSGNRYVFASTRTLTVTSTDASKTYGDDASTAIAGNYVITGYDAGITGVYLGDSAATALSGAASITSTGAAATANVAGSPYVMTAALGTLASQSGYAFTFASDGRLTVNQRAITVTAEAQTKVYGATDPTLTYTVGGSGLANGDTLSGLLVRTAGENVIAGGYAITQGGVTNTNNPNYAISYTGNTLTVTPATLTVAPNGGQSKTYGNADPTFGYAASGQVVNPTLGIDDSGLTLTGALGRAAGETVAGGPYGYTLNTLSAGANYTLVMATSPATFAITPATLTYSANTATRQYGDTNPTLSGAVTGYVNGDSAATVLAGTMTFSTSVTGTSGIGNYDITGSGLTANSNYVFAQATGNATALSITPRNITVTANAQTKQYGDADPALSYAVVRTDPNATGSGLVNNDTLSGALGRAAGENVIVGGYAITQGGVTNTNNPNYTITYVGNALTVTPARLTVTPTSGQFKIYGDADPTLTYAATGQVVNPALGIDDTNLVLTGVLGRVAGEMVAGGPYGYTLNTLSAGANYTLAIASNPSSFAITPRSIAVTVNASQTKLYGDANPALTYAVVRTDPNATGLGLVNGDSLSGSLFSSATTTSNVGGYAITQGSLAASSNYNLTSFTGSTLTVTQRPITVTADAKTKFSGDANPALTYAIGGSGLVNGDTLPGALATAANTGSPIGNYAITQGTITAPSGNYLLTYVGAILTVQPRVISDSYSAIVDRVLARNATSVTLPIGATAVQGAPQIMTANGPGTLYADPRSGHAFVCFGSACFAAF